MQQRKVIMRRDDTAIGTVSLIALLVIGALIALFIWQPWNGTVSSRSTTTTPQHDVTGDTR